MGRGAGGLWEWGEQWCFCPPTQGLGFLLPSTVEGGVGVKSDARNSGALWLFNPPPHPPHQKRKRKQRKEE